jgi:uncharacterized membrane protein
MKSEENRNYRTIFLLSIAAIVMMVVMSGYVWSQIPGGVGEQDEYAWKFLTIFAIPILIAITVGLLPLLARIEPRQLHIAQSHKALTTIWLTWLLYFLIIHTVILLNNLGRALTIATYWPVLAGLVTIVMGNYLGKIRSNNFAGFRTPWTLSSELSWNKTHRLGGKLLFLLGLILIAGSIIVIGEFWAYFLLVASIFWTVVLVVYSYFVWKSDPDRTRTKY